MAAQFAAPDAINFVAMYGRGLICLTLTRRECIELGLPQMVQNDEATFSTAFTVSVEARHGVTTGISAADRAHTIRPPSNRAPSRPTWSSQATSFRSGPNRAEGVLERTGQTEAGVDLARLAGLEPTGVICEIMNEDGTMSRVPDLIPYCKKHNLKMITVADLIKYRRGTRSWCSGSPMRGSRRGSVTSAPSATGACWTTRHVALVKGDVDGRRTCLSGCTPSVSPAMSSARCAATAASSSLSRHAHDRGGRHG